MFEVVGVVFGVADEDEGQPGHTGQHTDQRVGSGLAIRVTLTRTRVLVLACSIRRLSFVNIGMGICMLRCVFEQLIELIQILGIGIISIVITGSDFTRAVTALARAMRIKELEQVSNIWVIYTIVNIR